MLMTGLVIGLCLFAGRLAIYFILMPDSMRAWFEQSTKRMMILEFTNLLTMKIGGTITGIFVGATMTVLGIITSILLVQARKAVVSWHGSSFSQRSSVISRDGRKHSW